MSPSKFLRSSSPTDSNGEARAIAALNHTNICTLYDVGPDYLVMEYIEGTTLAERIQEGPIPLEEALGIARQIAAALEAAHDKGIVDFGLAKPVEAVEPGPDSPTMLSVFGTILGTVGYMAPEQARGKAVNKRADIWAFGVVLHEMLTGKRLFQGGDLVETLAAVVHKEPDLSGVPEKARPLLKRCLEKDPKKRLRDITGMEFLLVPEAHPPEVGKGHAATAASRLHWIAAGVLAVSLAAVSLIHFRETPPPRRRPDTASPCPRTAPFTASSFPPTAAPSDSSRRASRRKSPPAVVPRSRCAT
jgi:serine/threonine protein kinase